MIHKIKRHAKRITLDTIGWIFVILGLVGLVLPFLQGLLFLAIGFYILSIHSAYIQKIVYKIKHYHPKITPHFDRIEKKIEHFFRHLINRDDPKDDPKNKSKE